MKFYVFLYLDKELKQSKIQSRNERNKLKIEMKM